MRTALERARSIGLVRFAPDTEAAYAAVYSSLSSHRPGLLGALLERGPAHVRRLALIYALLEASEVIESRHLESALAFWELSEASAKLIFGHRTGDATLDRIMLELLPGQTMSLEEIRRDIFSGHVSAGKLRDALALGVDLGELALGERQSEKGRPAVTVTRRQADAARNNGAAETTGATGSAA